MNALAPRTCTLPIQSVSPLAAPAQLRGSEFTAGPAAEFADLEWVTATLTAAEFTAFESALEALLELHLLATSPLACAA